MKNIIYKFFIFFFSFFPIRRKKILFLSYYGSDYGCNPKYLSEYIVRKRKDWKVVWAFINPKEHNVEGVTKVKYLSYSYFYHLLTSKVFVTNYRMTELYKKRDGQFYVQTWHSSLRLKKIEADAVDSLTENYIKMAKADSKQTDLLISGCQFSTEIFRRAFWYDGPIVSTGTPRGDVLFNRNEELTSRIKESLGVNYEYKLVLYAPTFRKDHSLDSYDIDFTCLMSSLSQRFGGEWRILLRLHPHLRGLSEGFLNKEKEGKIIDVTNYDDILELLCVSDVVVSDYSALIFDFAVTNRPCFLYVPDLDRYTSNDRKLYFDINKLPFPRCGNNTELKNSIIEFDEENYAKNLHFFNETIGTYETGHACENVMREIESRI